MTSVAALRFARALGAWVSVPGFLALSIAMMLVSPARAIGPDWQLPAGSSEGIDTREMWLFGRQASLKTFQVQANIADVALGLIEQVSTPPQLQAMPDGLLMTGKAGEVHWLVRLVAASANRTQGSASAIDLQASPSLPGLPWQPAGMEVRMDVATRGGAGLVRQQVLTGTGTPEALHQRLCRVLQRQGWRADTTMVSAPCGSPPLAWPASTFWQRRGATLALVTDKQANGSSVFVLQTDPARAGLTGLPERLGDWLSHVRNGEVR